MTGTEAPDTLLGLLALSTLSAVLPIIPLEGVLAAASILSEDHPIWLIALIGAIGQMIGKFVFYVGGRRGADWTRRYVDKQRDTADDDDERRIARWSRKLLAVEDRHPIIGAAVNFLSAAIGLPPFAIMSIVAGVWKMPWWVFVLTGLAGRFIRFYAIVGATEYTFFLFGH